MKHQEIFDAFIRVNIDVDPKTKKRPDIFYTVQNTLKYKIVEIPTIIIGGGEYVLTGVEAFKWLESQLNKEEEREELTGFNSIEMGSFSDTYSSYGSNGLNDGVREQSFKFIGKPDIKINTPEETSGNISSEDYNLKQKERENIQMKKQGQGMQGIQSQGIQSQGMQGMQGMQGIQSQGMHPGIQNPVMNGPPMNFDRSLFTSTNNKNVSQKQKDFDSRYQQMLAERENV
jgi:hypothetical protein